MSRPASSRLTDRERRELFEAQGYRCCVRGCESEGPFEDEHSCPDAIERGKPDQIMCVMHHKQKTKRDRPVIAKVKRLRGDTTTQWARREARKAEGKSFFRSAGFPKKSARTREQILGEQTDG